jgi:hypothetical protein
MTQVGVRIKQNFANAIKELSLTAFVRRLLQLFQKNFKLS